MGDQPSRGSWRREHRTTLSLLLGIVLLLGAFGARFAYRLWTTASSSPSAVLTLPTATAFPTATPLPGTSLLAGGGAVYAAATPYATPIIPGFPRPDQDNPTQQQLRNQIGNPAKVIMISLQGQFIQAWQNGQLVRWSYVTTGKPESPTPTGIYAIGYKLSPFTFSSASPKNSAGWYYPTKGNFALYFATGGYFIHDSWWRTVYGPGLTTWHYDPGRGEWQEGSHGCVNTPLEMMGWLYLWADVGTPVIIY